MTFSTRLRSISLSEATASSFIQRDRSSMSSRNGHSLSMKSDDQHSLKNDDRTSGLGSLVPSPVQSPVVSLVSDAEWWERWSELSLWISSGVRRESWDVVYARCRLITIDSKSKKHVPSRNIEGTTSVPRVMFSKTFAHQMASPSSRPYELEWKPQLQLLIAVLLRPVSTTSSFIPLSWSIERKHTSTSMRFVSFSSSTDKRMYFFPSRSSIIIKLTCYQSCCKKRKNGRNKWPPLTSRSRLVSMNRWTTPTPMNRWSKKNRISRLSSITITMVWNVCATFSISIN